MPTVRYQIRNEYGLADPEFYRAADKDDPEAVLEGVAMAGLVGVLRQLGDLAEFAAGIFHDLHEEVTSTAARGHALLLRVQQLEAEFPSIEKAFLVQTNHSQFAYNDGIDWHGNLKMDQNLVTQGEMPRFVLDSYEECRGPPRFFMLDKFDVAGAGACSKRYSDPSFFKVEFSSSGMMEEEIRWENKPRKIRKKASRWKNVETDKSLMAPLISSNLQTENSDHVSPKVPAKRVKLKSRNLVDSDITNRKGYLSHILEVHSPEYVCPDNSINHIPEVVKSIDSSGLSPEAHEVVVDTVIDSPIVRAPYPTEPATRKEMSYFPTDEFNNYKTKRVETLEFTLEKQIMIMPDKTESFDGYMSDNSENRSPMLMEVGQQKPFPDGEFSTGAGFDHDKSGRCDEGEKSPVVLPKVDPEKYLASCESTSENEYGEQKSDNTSSDLEKYVDALNSTESEVEPDPEITAKSERRLSNMRTHWIDSGVCGSQDLPAQPSEPDSLELSASRESNGILECSSGSVNSGDLAETKQPLEDVSDFSVPAKEDAEVSPCEKFEKLDELQGSDEMRECELSVLLLPNGTCSDKESDVARKSFTGEESIGSHVMELIATHLDIHPEGSKEAQSVTSLHDDRTGYAEESHVVSQQLDGEMEDHPHVANNLINISGESIPPSEMGDLFLEKKDVLHGIDPACVQGQNSEESTTDMFDHLSEAKDRSIFEEIPAEHIGESMFRLVANRDEQAEPAKEVETCLDGSESPNVSESSPEISSNDVQNSHESVRDLDDTLPHTDEIRFTQLIMKSGISCDDPFPLSDIPASSSTESVELLFSEDMEDVQAKIISEEVPSELVEDPSVLNVERKAWEDPTEHDNKICSHENLLQSDPALSHEKYQFTMQSDLLPIGVRNVVAADEDSSTEHMEESSLLPMTIPLGLDHFSKAEYSLESHEANLEEVSTMSSQKETFLDDMQLQLNTSAEDGKRNTLMPNEKLLKLEDSSRRENPQDSHDEGSTKYLILGSSNAMFTADMQLQDEGSCFVVKSDEEEIKESPDAASMEHLPLDASDEALLNDTQVLSASGHMMTSDENDLIECPTAESANHFPLDYDNGIFPDDFQLKNKEHGPRLMGTLGLPGGYAASDLHNESALENYTGCTEPDDSFDEYVIVEADDRNKSICSVYSGKSSGFDMQLQENYLSHCAVLDQHDMEVKESSYVDRLTLISQNKSHPLCTTRGLNSSFPVVYSSDPGDTNLLDTHSCTIILKPENDRENSVCSLENGASGPKDDDCQSSHFVEDGSESIVASSHQDINNLKSIYTQSQITSINDINFDQSTSKSNADQPSKLEPQVIVSSCEIDEPDMFLSEVGVHEKVVDDACVASGGSSEIAEAFLMSSVSAAGLAPILSSTNDISESGMQKASSARSCQIISKIGLQEAIDARYVQDLSEISIQESNSILQETSSASCSHTTSENGLQEMAESWPGVPSFSSQSQDVVQTPPLPPLPPMEWRMGKLRLGSLTFHEDTVQSPTVTNPSMELISGDGKYPQGPPTIVDEMVQPETSFASLPPVSNENFHHLSLISEEENTQPKRLSELPPIADERRQHRSPILNTELTYPSNSFQAASRQENEECSYHGASVLELDDRTTQHPNLSWGQSEEGRPQVGHLVPSLVLERNQYEASKVARDLVHPSNSFFVGSSTEDWKHQFGYEVYGGESDQPLKFSAPLAARGQNMPPYGFLYSMGQNPSTMYDFSLATMEGEKPIWTYRSIRDRPRDPLIEAVAAHDKSKLRKVSELDRPSATPISDERDSLLEQIRNKAFSLKSGHARKPNIKGVPPTNLKVAAILEKANAIRQACVGSDEDNDDDGDSWSDS